MLRRALSFLLLMPLFASPALAQPVVVDAESVDFSAVDLATLEGEHWYLDTIDGQPSGYTHDWVIVDDEYITSGYESQRTESHGGDLMVSMNKVVWVETHDFQVVSVTIESSAGTEVVTQTYRFNDDGIELVSEQSGRTSTRQLGPIEGDWLTPTQAGIAFEQMAKAGEDEMSFTTWDPELGNRTVDVGYTRVGEVEVEAMGEAVEAVQWISTYSALPGIELLESYNAEFDLVRQEIEFSGLKMATVIADESVAALDFDPPEMAQQSTVRPDTAISRPTRVKQAIFDLTFSESAPEDLVPPTMSHQRAERLDNGKVRITINLDSVNAVPEGDEPTDENMAASLMVDHTDEKVMELAQAVRDRAGEGADTLRIARSCRRFVTRYMTGINLATGDATASEVARSRSGDCTECSVLLAAMLRANGIPSRCVTGLAYSDQDFAGESDIFVYHMWTQAWIEDDEGEGGRWVDLDAAMWRYTGTHIALGTSNMDDASSASDMIEMVPMMNGLEIEVVETSQ